MAVNLSLNPTAANNMTDWTEGAWARQTGQSVGNTGRTTCGRVTVAASAYPAIGSAGTMEASAALSAGKVYSYVAWVRSSVARNYIHFLSRYNGNSYQGSASSSTTVALAANTWTKIRGSGTVPTGGTYTRIGVHSDFPTAAAGTIDLGAIRIVEGSDSTIEFADGSTSGWSWDGTTGNSTSSDIVVVATMPPGRMLLAC